MRKVTHVDSSRDMPWFWNFIASGRSKAVNTIAPRNGKTTSWMRSTNCRT